LPGERVRIEPPYLIINDAKVPQPDIYQDIASKTNGQRQVHRVFPPFPDYFQEFVWHGLLDICMFV